jgi:hypothetical protein
MACSCGDKREVFKAEGGGQLMSRGAQTFKQGDVTKAVKGAVNAGLEVQRVEIDQAGKIVVFAGKVDIANTENETRVNAGEWKDEQ